MSELLNLVQAQWPYALALVIGFPLALVALNEAGFALARAGRPVAASVRFLKKGVFDAQGLVTVPRPRLIRRLGVLPPVDLAAVEAAVRAWLGL